MQLSFVLRSRLLKGGTNSLDIPGGVVGTLGTTLGNDVDVLNSGGLNDGSQNLLSDTHESVGVGGRLHGNTNASVSSWMGWYK